jgi:hypothetical protein
MAKAQWTPKDYTLFFLLEEPTHSPKEIRAEYTRMRDIMMKRAKRLEEAGFTAQASYIRKMMPKLSEIGEDNTEVAHRLSYGKKSLYEQRSYSLAGIKSLQKMINDETGEIVPLGEVLKFNEYMQSWRLSAFSSTIVPSDLAASLYEEDYQDVGGTFSDFYTLFKQM